MPSFNTGRDIARITRTLQSQLEPVIGADAASVLAPRFAKAAAEYQPSQLASEREARRRREIATSQLAALDAVMKAIGRLSKRIDALTTMVPGAYAHGYLPGSDAASGTLRRLGVEAVMQGKLNRILEAARIVSPDLQAWRGAAKWDTQRKRGRKIGDRRYLNAWVVIQLDKARVPVKKNPNGIVVEVLEIVYNAIGIKPPDDLYRDIVIAIDDTARERRNLH